MGLLSGIARALGVAKKPRRHASAKRSRAVRKYGLSPRQLALKAEREAREQAATNLYYHGREARYNRMSQAGFPAKKSARKTTRKLRQYTSVRGVMRQGYKKTT